MSPSDVNRFLDRRANIARGVRPINVKEAIQLRSFEQLGSNALFEHNPCVQHGAPRLLVANGGRFVPHGIIRPENLDQHHHVDAVEGSEHRATENRPDVVAGFPIQRQFDPHLADVSRNVRNASACWD